VYIRREERKSVVSFKKGSLIWLNLTIKATETRSQSAELHRAASPSDSVARNDDGGFAAWRILQQPKKEVQEAPKAV